MSKNSYFNAQGLCRIVDDILVIKCPREHDAMPIIKKQGIDLIDMQYVSFQNTRQNDDRDANKKTIGFFIQDCKFECVRRKPWQYVERFLQYKQVMSLDLSCFRDMPISEQRLSVYQNRVIGAFWQHAGLTVIPSVTWGDDKSYGFTFSGIEEDSIVAVSTIGTRANYELFMMGFIEMCRRINPQKVICYCHPYKEMYDYANILHIEYAGREPWRIARHRQIPGQLSLFDYEEDA
ncbi:MAG: DUF4417 domain-containing protein [Coriobacteriales bacterium]|jgi:hypothetical protein|nr:DUF4417 domain-containing protein [Coriobacteriales bacterium]